MKKFRKILHRLLHPGAAVLILSVLAGAGLLVYAFVFAGDDNPVTYLSYVVSAYALLVLCFNLIPFCGQLFIRHADFFELDRDGQKDHHHSQKGEN